MSSKTLTLIAGGVFIFLADQAVKWYLLADLSGPGDSRSFLGIVEFYIVENYGMAFGVGSGGMWIAGVLVVALGLFAFLYAKYFRKSHWSVQVASGVVLGGAVSNLLDRILRGAVVDYIGIYIFPVFNLADVGILLGILLIIGAVTFWPGLMGSTQEKSVVR